MEKSRIKLWGVVSILSLAVSCTSSNQNKPMKTEYQPGTFGFDQKFLEKQRETVILSDTTGNSEVIIIPDWQARVMTSTANGKEGFSYGWINYKLIESGEKTPHINAFGGEERLWLGPEGGPFSIYFIQGAEQVFSNWNVPAELDTLGFELVSKSRTKASFSKNFQLTNYSGTKLSIGIERNIELLDREDIEKFLGLSMGDSLKYVAYQTSNFLSNKGEKEWTRESGMLSLWMLSMLNPSPEVTIFIPYRNLENQDGIIVNDDYFGKVPANRLTAEKGIIWFKADGKFRSKIGIPPQRAMNFSGSYDAQNKALTLLWCDLAEGNSEYVNSKWGKQDDPFSGDAINAYNDGPVEDGTQMGPFYELESSSPAAHLKPVKNCSISREFFISKAVNHS